MGHRRARPVLPGHGAIREALADIDRALEHDDDPEDGWYRYLRALVLFGLNRTTDARRDLEIAVDLARSQCRSGIDVLQNTMNLVVYLAALGDFENARSSLEEVLRQPVDAHISTEMINDLRDLAMTPGVDIPEVESLITALTDPVHRR